MSQLERCAPSCPRCCCKQWNVGSPTSSPSPAAPVLPPLQCLARVGELRSVIPPNRTGLRPSSLARPTPRGEAGIRALLALPPTLPAISHCGVSIALQPERRGGEA